MNEKFDPKVYLSKTRIYRSINGYSGIARTYVWNGSEYVDPPNGGRYLVRKTIIQANGETDRVSKQFDDLETARCWKDGIDPARLRNPQTMTLEAIIEQASISTDLRFGDVLKDFDTRHLQTVSISTARKYRQQIELHFGALKDIPMNEFKPVVIDKWLDKLKESKSGQSRKRRDFRHELSLLSTVFQFYREYYDEELKWINPIKVRHKAQANLKKGPKKAVPYMTREEFFLFREKLMGVKHGGILAIMATCQYFQALRISEAAALMDTSFRIDWDNPSSSRVVITGAVKWRKDTGVDTHVGKFKNSDFVDGVKEQPLFPEPFSALQMLNNFREKKGLLFSDNGRLFEFRQIEGAYNTAFALADLPYRGTHIMRHGGCRDVYNSTGDLAIAQQHLGNSSLKSTMVYAKREAGALTKVAEQRWANVRAVDTNVIELAANGSKPFAAK